MRDFGKKLLIVSIICAIKHFGVALSREIVFYLIELNDTGLHNCRNTDINIFDFKLSSRNILDEFKNVHLLDNQTLKCQTNTEELIYYNPKIIKIQNVDNFTIDTLVNEDKKNNNQIYRLFLGRIQQDFINRFVKYATVNDSFFNVHSEELSNILNVLDTLEFKKTKKNERFLNYLFVNSFMCPDFDYDKTKFLIGSYNYEKIFTNLTLEYLFFVFEKFLFIQRNRPIFLSLKSDINLNQKRPVISYRSYAYRKEKLEEENMFIASHYNQLYMQKILSLNWSLKCSVYFAKFIKIDSFFIKVSDINLNGKYLNFISLIKPFKLYKLTLIDESDEKMTFKAFIYLGYLYIAEHIKINSSLNKEDLRFVIGHCGNIKKLHIKSDKACYDSLFDLSNFASSKKDALIKYKCKEFLVQYHRKMILDKMPNNLLFFAEKIQYYTSWNCHLCFKNSHIYFRNYNFAIKPDEDYRNFKVPAANLFSLKYILISSSTEQFFPRINIRFLDYLNQMSKVKTITFKHISLTEEVIMFILKHQLVFFKFENVEIQTKILSKYKLNNLSLRGITIKGSSVVLNIDFLKFLYLFQNISFLKVEIHEVDSKFENQLSKLISSSNKGKKRKKIAGLDYLKISFNKEIKKSFPVLFALSHFFDLSRLNVLILYIYGFDEKDLEILMNICDLNDVSLTIYKKDSTVILEKFTRVIQNNNIVRLSLEIYSLKESFLFLVELKRIKFVYLYFFILDKENINLIQKSGLINQMNFRMYCYHNSYTHYSTIMIGREFCISKLHPQR